MSAHKQYLGDSVYVDLREGFSSPELVLTTENGGMPSNQIVLDSETVAALLRYIERLRTKKQEEKT